MCRSVAVSAGVVPLLPCRSVVVIAGEDQSQPPPVTPPSLGSLWRLAGIVCRVPCRESTVRSVPETETQGERPSPDLLLLALVCCWVGWFER